jgi:hypothetical protein
MNHEAIEKCKDISYFRHLDRSTTNAPMRMQKQQESVSQKMDLVSNKQSK